MNQEVALHQAVLDLLQRILVHHHQEEDLAARRWASVAHQEALEDHPLASEDLVFLRDRPFRLVLDFHPACRRQVWVALLVWVLPEVLRSLLVATFLPDKVLHLV